MLAQREATRRNESSLLKQQSRKRIRRLEKEGINAILFDQESDNDDDETRKGRQQVGASDLVALLKSKYIYMYNCLYHSISLSCSFFFFPFSSVCSTFPFFLFCFLSPPCFFSFLFFVSSPCPIYFSFSSYLFFFLWFSFPSPFSFLYPSSPALRILQHLLFILSLILLHLVSYLFFFIWACRNL